GTARVNGTAGAGVVPAGGSRARVGAADRVIRHTVDADIRRKKANDSWGDIMARAAPYHRGGGGEVPPRYPASGDARGGGGASVATARAACHAYGLGRCDGRHGLLFECPIIFWTPCAPVHFLHNERSVK